MENQVTVKAQKAFAMLGISNNSGYRLLASGALEATKIGDRWLIPLSSIEKFSKINGKGETKIEMENDKKCYSPEEAAHALSISISLCRRLIKEGKIKSVRLGERRIIIPATAIDDLLKEAE